MASSSAPSKEVSKYSIFLTNLYRFKQCINWKSRIESGPIVWQQPRQSLSAKRRTQTKLRVVLHLLFVPLSNVHLLNKPRNHTHFWRTPTQIHFVVYTNSRCIKCASFWCQYSECLPCIAYIFDGIRGPMQFRQVPISNDPCIALHECACWLNDII